MQKLCFLLILSLLLLGVVNCQEQTTPEPIRIGLVAPFTGDLNTLGEAALNAALLWVEAINNSGGLEVNGITYQIELLIEDSEGIPEKAIEATRSLIFRQDVVAVVGPMISRTAIPASVISEEAQIPMLLPNATNPEATNGKFFVYRIAFVDSFQGSLMAIFSHEQLQAQKAAVLFDTANKYNHDVAHFYKDAFIDLGGEIVAFEPYFTGTQDFSQQLAAISAATPDILFLPNYSYELMLQIDQIRAANIQATLVGSDGWSGILPENLPRFEGAYFSSHYATDLPNEKAVVFRELFEQTYQKPANESAALTYDAFGLLLQAIQTSGVTPEAIQEGLQQTEQYEGVTGTMLYDQTGDPLRSAVILRIVNGTARHFDTIDPHETMAK
jgi:branched-chain amino acid transport system substrate-binding protein